MSLLILSIMCNGFTFFNRFLGRWKMECKWLTYRYIILLLTVMSFFLTEEKMKIVTWFCNLASEIQWGYLSLCLAWLWHYLFLLVGTNIWWNVLPLSSCRYLDGGSTVLSSTVNCLDPENHILIFITENPVGIKIQLFTAYMCVNTEQVSSSSNACNFWSRYTNFRVQGIGILMFFMVLFST